jgi:hypothetical protein
MKNRHVVIFGLLPLALFLIGAAAVSRDLVIQNASNAPGVTIIKPGSQTSNLIEAYIGSGSKLSLSRDGNMALNGYLSLSGATNRLTVADGALKLDGSAIAGGAFESSDGFIVPSGTTTESDAPVTISESDGSMWVGKNAHQITDLTTFLLPFSAVSMVSSNEPTSGVWQSAIVNDADWDYYSVTYGELLAHQDSPYAKIVVGSGATNGVVSQVVIGTQPVNSIGNIKPYQYSLGGTNRYTVDFDASMVIQQVDTEPAAPSAGKFTLFAIDNGSGKMVLKVRFPTGASQVVATQP